MKPHNGIQLQGWPNPISNDPTNVTQVCLTTYHFIAFSQISAVGLLLMFKVEKLLLNKILQILYKILNVT